MEIKKDFSIERRKFQRFGCCMPAQCKQLGNIRDEVLGALTKDVSEGGTRLVTESFIPVNSRIVLILSFPFEGKLSIILKLPLFKSSSFVIKSFPKPCVNVCQLGASVILLEVLI